jgi:hypothetical protein
MDGETDGDMVGDRKTIRAAFPAGREHLYRIPFKLWIPCSLIDLRAEQERMEPSRKPDAGGSTENPFRTRGNRKKMPSGCSFYLFSSEHWRRNCPIRPEVL